MNTALKSKSLLTYLSTHVWHAAFGSWHLFPPYFAKILVNTQSIACGFGGLGEKSGCVTAHAEIRQQALNRYSRIQVFTSMPPANKQIPACSDVPQIFFAAVRKILQAYATLPGTAEKLEHDVFIGVLTPETSLQRVLDLFERLAAVAL